jgi:hypothetical protein
MFKVNIFHISHPLTAHTVKIIERATEITVIKATVFLFKFGKSGTIKAECAVKIIKGIDIKHTTATDINAEKVPIIK